MYNYKIRHVAKESYPLGIRVEKLNNCGVCVVGCCFICKCQIIYRAVYYLLGRMGYFKGAEVLLSKSYERFILNLTMQSLVLKNCEKYILKVLVKFIGGIIYE